MADRDPRIPKKFDIVRKIQRPGMVKPYWAPVGQITLWQDEEGKISGKCLINAFGEEFSVFTQRPRVVEQDQEKQEPAGTTDFDKGYPF